MWKFRPPAHGTDIYMRLCEKHWEKLNEWDTIFDNIIYFQHKQWNIEDLLTLTHEESSSGISMEWHFKWWIPINFKLQKK